MSNLIHAAVSNKVLGAAFAVHGALGSGLLESVYEGALVVEFTHRGIFFERQKTFPLEYRREYIGAYIADDVVENTVIRSSRRRNGHPWPLLLPPSMEDWMRQSRECHGWQN